MVTGLDVANKAIWTINAYRPRYNSWIGELRCHPDRYPHVCDCSGLWCFVLAQLGIGVGCTNSAWFAQIGHQQGLGVSIDYALHHPGCLLLRGPDEGQQGYGNRGHVGGTVGDGVHSIEARGTRAGVGIFEADDIWWVYAMKIPRVIYVAMPPPIVKPPPKPKEEGEVFVLPGQSNSNFRPVGVQVVGGAIYIYNVSKNPFKEGTIVTAMDGNGHKLRLALATGEEILGATNRTPDGKLCPPDAPIEIYTNLPSDPNTRGQPRHILHRV